MSDRRSYEVVVVGGGPAGLTTALYTTRLGHRTAVFEVEGGRHAAVSHVHNLYGVSEDVSGRELASHAVAQLREYGGDYHLDAVETVRRAGVGDAGAGDAVVADDAGSDGDARFVVETGRTTVDAERVVFATGFTDVGPSVPDLERFTGRGLHYCLHCDAYGLGDSPTFVLGHGEDAAHVAMVMLNVTADVDLLLDGRDPEWSAETDRQLRAHPVDLVGTAVEGAFPRGGDEHGAKDGNGSGDGNGDRAGGAGGAGDDGGDGDVGGSASEAWLGGLSFADGTEREYRGGFAMYGREYNTGVAETLGCELADDGALAVDEDHETSVAGAYAVGDVTHGQNQTAIALGDGARAGVAIHKDLRRFPRPVDGAGGGDEAAGGGDDEAHDGALGDNGSLETGAASAEVPAASAEVRARMRLVREQETHAGLRGQPPDR